jgi:hypothetical protein
MLFPLETPKTVMLRNFHSHVVPIRNPQNSHVTEFPLSRCPQSKPQKQSCYRIFTFTLSPLETTKTAMLRNFYSHVVPTGNHKNSHVIEFLLSPCPQLETTKTVTLQSFHFHFLPTRNPKTVMLRNFHSQVVPTQNPQNIHATEFSLSFLSHGH